ncbi:MAG: hypothetical protein ABIV94_11465 [Acidimicrobiales bacterium]
MTEGVRRRRSWPLLYLVFNEGYSGAVDLAAEAILQSALAQDQLGEYQAQA